MARDTQLDRTVAIKIPRKGALDAQESELFLRDARAAAQLKHPHIVGVHEVGREDGTLYIVSDYIDGANLKEWLSGQRLSFGEAAQLVVKVAEALEHAHQSGVVHRDLKPGNIMLDGDGQPHVIDFGLAKRDAGEITMTVDGHILGTPAYMSPEQAKGKGHNADRRSDVYSLGVILFELLTGELPFRGETQMLLYQIQRDEPPRPRRLNARIPRDLETITLACLEKEPSRRYQTAGELAADLRRWLNNEPVVVRPVSRAERGWRWCRRNPVVASLAGAVALALVTGTSVATYFAIHANTQRDRAQQERENSRHLLYDLSMSLAQREWDDGQIDHVATLLSQNIPKQGETDLRGWEWYYQSRILHAALRTLKGHSGSVLSVAFNSNGNRVASGSVDQTIKAWDVATGVELRTLKGHTDAVSSVSFSRDGRWLASGSFDKTIRLWDAETGAEVRAFKGHTDRVASVSFRPDSQRLASASYDHTIKLWDVATGAELRTLYDHKSAVLSVSFSPDGQRLASASAVPANTDPNLARSTIKISDADTGAELRTLDGLARDTVGLSFSPDGQQIAASIPSAIRIWDVDTGTEVCTLDGHASYVSSLSFSPEGQRLVSAGRDGTLKLWNANSRVVYRTLNGHTSPVNSACFSPDGRWIASASEDRTVKLWDAERGAAVQELNDGPNGAASGNVFSKQAPSVSFDRDSRWLASAADDGTIKLWDTEAGDNVPRTVKSSAGDTGCVSFSPDWQVLASRVGGITINLWNAETGARLRVLRGHTRNITIVVFSADGRRLASADSDHVIKLWDVATGAELRTLKGHTEGVSSVSFSRDGRWLASGSLDKTIMLWDADAGAGPRILKGHTDRVASVCFGPDGRQLASASYDHTIKLWDVATGAVVHTQFGHTSSVLSVCFSPDGRRLVSASKDSTIRLWDAETGAELRKLTVSPIDNFTGHASSVCFSPDGRWLVSVDEYIQGWFVQPIAKIRMRDSSVLSDDEATARSLVGRLFEDLKSPDKVVAAIERAEGWNDPMRKAGLRYAQLHTGPIPNFAERSPDPNDDQIMPP